MATSKLLLYSQEGNKVDKVEGYLWVPEFEVHKCTGCANDKDSTRYRKVTDEYDSCELDNSCTMILKEDTPENVAKYAALKMGIEE